LRRTARPGSNRVVRAAIVCSLEVPKGSPSLGCSSELLTPLYEVEHDRIQVLPLDGVASSLSRKRTAL
jgi:hypothetical protein